MNTQEPLRRQVRVLVVDDDPRVQSDMVHFLEDEGNAVKALQAAGKVLFEETQVTARSFRPHVAIVDISLDGSLTNRGGITLLEDLKSAGCILYSSRLSWDITRDIQRTYPKATWVDVSHPEFRNRLEAPAKYCSASLVSISSQCSCRQVEKCIGASALRVGRVRLTTRRTSTLARSAGARRSTQGRTASACSEPSRGTTILLNTRFILPRCSCVSSASGPSAIDGKLSSSDVRCLVGREE